MGTLAEEARAIPEPALEPARTPTAAHPTLAAVLFRPHLNDGKISYAKQREAMQILLSGVDPRDSLKIRDSLSPSQKFLRVEKEDIKIAYGRMKFHFLPRVPVYRIDVMPDIDIEADEGITDDGHQGPTAPESEGFWRMVHLDFTHIFDGANTYRKYGRNFRTYGVRHVMTKYEWMDRFEYEYGEGEWNQPHFIPGVFIAMTQRYRRREWVGQGDEVADVPPVWQILLTDGPNDILHAHIYTTQVPDFLVSYFDTPTEMFLPLPPTDTQSNGAADHGSENKEEIEEVPFDFRIRHTIVAYRPSNTFRERLRESIMLSRDSFRNEGEHAQSREQHEETQPDKQSEDTTS
ncbi:hypothetical protein O1611_g6765 [Lasiodiplodia mahajangana]|uniref:Uncharacterized protein n=1 Tax=Lasiodiplodia mahajangana TaxID=1108764 RepID=A0ACC2JHL3_9PEZI|nr:hypothetical protein O1611_g6765 [Lasiodiplodia mahajangana]